MAQSAAVRRLRKEYANLEKEPAPGAIARPLERNFLHAHFLLHGPVFYDTPFEGGVYHGVLKFPPQYPMKPPSVIMRTPSGRFQPDKKICFSLSDFHPELWNPMWSIRTILTGLVSFMNSDEITTGGLADSNTNRIAFAKQSLNHCFVQDDLAKELFEKELTELKRERESMGNDSWPPSRPAEMPLPAVTATNVDKASTAKRKPTKARTKQRVDEQPHQEEQSRISGKNAAKNKKKREREKRRKFVKHFLDTLVEQVPEFIQAVETQLSSRGLNVRDYTADHVCWRTESIEEYNKIVGALSTATDDCTLLIESVIGGRSIATFSLSQGIQAGDRVMRVVEIPAPKNTSPYRSGLEHVEYVVGNDPNISPINNDAHNAALANFMKQYPSLDWSAKAIDKNINPDVSVKLEVEDFGVCSVKFHLVPLADVIAYEKKCRVCRV